MSDAFERARQERVRNEMEEAAAGLRLREEPRSDLPEKRRAFYLRFRAQEDQRIADERAGRPTQAFREMNGLELFYAMASYPRGRYPADLEQAISERAAAPVPQLTPDEQEALLEVLSLESQLKSEPAVWMVERLAELMSHHSASVALKAAAVVLEMAGELKG